MPGDYSRFTDDELKRRAAVYMQQGKVQLDADWNEQAEIQLRRDRLQSLDIMGNSAVPRETTPDAFKITANNGGPAPNLNIGHGRMYVGGLVAEAFQSDPLTYLTQPFFRKPLPDALPGGKSLIYLDVWQREMTYIEDPSMLEPALGDVDTATRLQTVWQVRAASLRDHPGLKCDSNLYEAFPATDAKLTVKVNLPADKPDPCQLPEVGGFLDVENRHYRVELHGENKIKFARDPVVSAIESTPPIAGAGQTTITVRRIGRDSMLRFEIGNFVEVVNDQYVLNGKPGIFGKILNLNEALRQITIDQVITADDVDADLHPYLVRWDGDLEPHTGTITLEAGIEVTITGTRFRNGDYWYFPARAATRSAGPLIDPSPRGVKHYYAALATIDVKDGKVTVLSDCRVLWPPECDCECTVCVSPESHHSGVMTIQMAVEKVKKTNHGGKICLKPGVYQVRETITIAETHAITMTGHGWARIVYTGNDRHLLLLDEVAETTIEGIWFQRAGHVQGGQEAAAVTVRNCWSNTTIRECVIHVFTLEGRGIGVSLEDALFDVDIHDCVIYAATAIGSLSGTEPATGASRGPLDFAVMMDVRDCLLHGTNAGITLLAAIVGDIHIHENEIDAGSSAGIRIEGTTAGNSAIRVENNEILSNRTGISIRADRTTVAGNRLAGSFKFDPKALELQTGRETDSGIALYTETPFDTLRSILVTGNRISNFLGAGILITDPVDDVLIKMNFIEQTALGGIVLGERAKGSKLQVDNNELRDVALADDPVRHVWHGMHFVVDCEVGVIGNVITNVGLPGFRGRTSFVAAGIHADSPRYARIHLNKITGVAAFPSTNPDSREASAGIEILPPFGTAIVTENLVVAEGFEGQNGIQHCYALRVRRLITELVWPIGDLTTREFAGWVYMNFDLPWVVLLPPRMELLVRANHFECRGQMNFRFGVVDVEADPLVCTFGGNICTSTTHHGGAVRLTAHTGLIVDSNHVLDFHDPSMELESNKERWTIVGNVVNNGIQINGKPLNTIPPWNGVNRT